jgi:hypothetical protein
MASLRRLVIPATLSMTLIGTSFVACESDSGGGPPGPIGGSNDPTADAAPGGGDGGLGDGGEGGDGGTFDAPPSSDASLPPDAGPTPDAPVG